MDENQEKILEILTDNEEEKYRIYEEIKQEKREKDRKNLLKDFGNFPIYFMIMLSSLFSTVIIIFYLIMETDIRYNILVKFNQLEPYYTIFIIIFSIGIFFSTLLLFSLCLSLHDKKLELSINDNKK